MADWIYIFLPEGNRGIFFFNAQTVKDEWGNNNDIILEANI